MPEHIARFTFNGYDFTFTDSDVVEPSAFIPAGDYNPHNIRPWLLHDAGFTLAVVFADCFQDAIDIAADNGKLDRFRVTAEDIKDYEEDDERLDHLGNASEPFDIESLNYIELPHVPFSFAALFNASRETN